MKTTLRNLTKNPWLTLALLIATALLYTYASLDISDATGVDWDGSAGVFLMNLLPAALMLGLVWLTTGWAWLAALLTGAAVFLITVANHFVILFRWEPLKWKDMFLVKEAQQMTGQYEVVFDDRMYAFLALIAGAVLILALLGRGKPGPTVRLLSLTAVGVASLACFYEVFPDDDLYNTLGREHAFNGTYAYAACGAVYPFFHSYGDYMGAQAGYTEQNALNAIARYEDTDIPEEKKVNLVTIQLEAYADLTQFDIQGISPKVYQSYHTLLEESYHGSLLVDVFAGGTAETEWAVITGGNEHGDFDQPTSSAAWYLKTQGYTTGGGHPSREWFYDRAKVNPNLGLDNYLFMENYYDQYAPGEDVAYDDTFFPDLKKRLTENFAAGSPFLSFNVTYQGHGPYNLDKTWWGNSYCTGDYPEHIDNCLNNYLYLMQDTGDRSLDLIRWLDRQAQPVVLVLYGDHMPWMGSGGSIYQELDINMDLTTEEGFRNHYTTWYAIYANPAAEEILGREFVGQGPDLSACFLLNHVFDLCGWQGSARMQAQTAVAEELPVIHTTGWVKENGRYTRDPSEEAETLIRQFQDVSLYDRTHWSGAVDPEA